MKKIKVMALTAIRSEYFLQRSILSTIAGHADLELDLVVSGAHLTPIHNYTVKIVEDDGFSISDRIESLVYSDSDASRLKGASIQLNVLSHIVDNRRPDWLLAVGDREEPMLLALCGTYMNIPVAHYSAGDRVVGNADDTIRHAVSRLSHLLLTTHEEARKRLIRAGEEEWRVHNVGHAGLDRFRSTPPIPLGEMAKALKVDRIKEPYVIVIQHPLSSEIERSGEYMRETMVAIEKLGLQTFVSYPNSDPGHEQIIQVIEEYRNRGIVYSYRNIPDILFVNLLRNASVLIGNSSMGLLESPFLRLPAINVGHRQMERHHAENLFFVESKHEKIVRKVQTILEDETTRLKIKKCSNPFGDGRTGERIAELLASTPINDVLINRDLAY